VPYQFGLTGLPSAEILPCSPTIHG
jgi:hypothetical protein